MQRVLIISCLFVFACLGQVSAQSSVEESFTGLPVITESLLHLNNSQWSYAHDDSDATYYLDFQLINVNLQNLVVRNEVGLIVYSEDVTDLPVDAIYEIDLGQFGKGSYEIELQTFTDKTIKKKFRNN
jgi:hypothetical protein